jgi:DNA-binding transcriptional MerR regulator
MMQFLTIAECAFRTGLTIRALRLYEEYGLLRPQRSPGGWRQYGPRDLVQLNTITLFKTAGLSLSQTRELIGSGPDEQALQKILPAQLQTWKSRQLAAQRGVEITAAALDRLKTQGALCVDELCKLIGALETTQSRSSVVPDTVQQDCLTLDPAVLDSYAGFYRHSEYIVERVYRDGPKLLIRALTDAPSNLPSPALRPTSATEFTLITSARTTERQYVFERDPAGTVTAMVLRHRGVELRFPRIDAHTAEQVRQRWVARLHDAQPLPGSEAALRHLIEAIRANRLDPAAVSPAMAATLWQRLTELHSIAVWQGEIRAIEFAGVGRQGWDVYDVRCEHGSSRWRILIDSDGKVADAISARIHSTRPLTGSEAALRGYIEGIRANAPDYDRLTPALARVTRRNLAKWHFAGIRLGAVEAIEFRGVEGPGWDVYTVHREGGTSRWKILMAADGKIAAAAGEVTDSALLGP